MKSKIYGLMAITVFYGNLSNLGAAPISLADALEILGVDGGNGDEASGPIKCSLDLKPERRKVEAERSSSGLSLQSVSGFAPSIKIPSRGGPGTGGFCRVTESVIQQCKAALGNAVSASADFAEAKEMAKARAIAACTSLDSLDRKCDQSTKPFCQFGDNKDTACLKGRGQRYTPANGAPVLCAEEACAVKDSDFTLRISDPGVEVTYSSHQRLADGTYECTMTCRVKQDNQYLTVHLNAIAKGKKCYHCQHSCITSD